MPTARPDLDLSAVLGSLADAMLDAQPWVGPARATFVALSPDGDGLDFGFKELDGHPADTLLGFVAPEEWLATGVSCAGWAARLEDFGELGDESDLWRGGARPVAPSAHPDRFRVRQACIVRRLGAPVSRLQVQGGEPADAGPTGGLLIDCLQRALDLPTAPPPTTVAEVMVANWCERVASLRGAGDAARGMWSWKALERVEPPPTPGGVGWHDLRWAAVTGTLPAEGLDPSVAAWMDDAMFARWLLPDIPRIDQARMAAATVFTPAGRRRFHTEVDAALSWAEADH